MLVPRKRGHTTEEFHLVEPFHDADGWYGGPKGRVAAREWALARMRLALSPRITAEHCKRGAIEYLVARRLHTTTVPDLSCSA
eukprot:8279746-Pyramimonas_sp.AAC.1